MIDIFIDGLFTASLETKKSQDIIEEIEHIVGRDTIMSCDLFTGNRVQVKTLKSELDNAISQISEYNEQLLK